MFDGDGIFDPSHRSITFTTALKSVSKSLGKVFESKIYTPDSLKERKKVSIPMWIFGGILFLSMAFVGGSVVS